MFRFLRGVLGVALLAAPGAASAFGNDDRWESGWGMGVAEAVVTRGAGNQIYVTCDEGADRNATAISFTLAGNSSKDSSVQLTFDGEAPEDYTLWDGQIKSDCRACAATYDIVIKKLKTHSSVHVKFKNGDAANFSLNGSSKAIGQCVADFYR
ncbi:hypothetical protein L905_18975 [Agrobacterium sp. TS43]|uniref:hypothetical protein n=1 Tax=Agrobacterium TaxID=357 RepID=UPI000745AB1A|nr:MULTISPECIES: hypothetical protein [Agrobacterium]KVK62655.1 hypothetical protein L906_18450 [Agrobacterium sp. TS45]KVK65040.1 hypothetical protein L905_18975 [Agrobacterium sp. TS43]KVK67105.1 hypothetical protein L907_18425 [Agrobacterium sp. C13]